MEPSLRVTRGPPGEVLASEVQENQGEGGREGDDDDDVKLRVVCSGAWGSLQTPMFDIVTYEVPHWLSVLVLRYLAVLVCIPPKEKSNRVTVSLNPSHKAPSANTSTTDLSDHQSISDVTLSASLDSPDPVLKQLRMLGKELTAIRVQMDKYCEGTKATQEWEMIGTVIDRLLFGLYIIFIFVSFITIISIWIWNHSFATRLDQ
ncbi:5-hydroxytryptamine receptor 3A-like [Neolamprologus brichardi]|uniref:5-hydroxytryptamine receptor 3A-like n=1 Tax=Neolamprologus brichardi TaxID=32507 RepID=UPI001643A619|nr:5-hydroxytryptamine receptor 3A-like [Neolamprologus brichardi]